jgi:hypothetical protein
MEDRPTNLCGEKKGSEVWTTKALTKGSYEENGSHIDRASCAACTRDIDRVPGR